MDTLVALAARTRRALLPRLRPLLRQLGRPLHRRPRRSLPGPAPAARNALAALAGALALAAGASAAGAAPAWITLSADALAVLQRMPARIEVVGTAQAQVTVPAAGARSAELATRSETVHAVKLDEDWLELLSVLVHGELQRCGGYLWHPTEADALAALGRLERAPGAGPHDSPQAIGQRPSYAIDNVAQVQALLPQLQASNVLGTITALTNFQNRRYNSTHGVQASDWLFAQWSTLNPGNRRDLRVTQVAHGGWAQKSVTFDFHGNGNSGETVIIGAHLDSIAGSSLGARAPGADDNASGVAALTEIIRVLVGSGYRPRRNLRFIAYSAEEVGLRASQAFAAEYLTRREQVVGVLNLDMTAYQGDTTDIWLYTDYTDAAQNGFLASLVQAYLPHLTVGWSACGYGCSDHAAWHGRGYYASFPHEASNDNYNRLIHTANDTVAGFGGTAAHALKFTQLALAYVVELGSDQRVPAQRAAGSGPGR